MCWTKHLGSYNIWSVFFLRILKTCVQTSEGHAQNVSYNMLLFQNKTCVQTLEGHAQNVSAVRFHPELPIILTGSEDGECILQTLLHFLSEKTCFCKSLNIHTNYFYVKYNYSQIIFCLVPFFDKHTDTTLYDKVCQWLATGRWFFLGTPVCSTNKTGRTI